MPDIYTTCYSTCQILGGGVYGIIAS